MITLVYAYALRAASVEGAANALQSLPNEAGWLHLGFCMFFARFSCNSRRMLLFHLYL